MIEGACHCGLVHWRLDSKPDSATACNCTVCRRYGALWAYGYLDRDVTIEGDTATYIRGDRCIGFHFCRHCGCVTHYLGLEIDDDGLRGAAVNLRMAEPGSVAELPIRRFDGLTSFQEAPDRGRCVAELWF